MRRRVAITISVLAAWVGLACSRREPAPIAAELDAGVAQVVPISTLPALPPPPPEEPRNPLAMPLKHDGPAAATVARSPDPCAVVEPTGPLAMRLKHGRDGGARRNPLCMPIK